MHDSFHDDHALPNQHLRRSLRADCSRCFGLCCVALSFARSTDFATDKPAGTPCENLLEDHGCRIHDRLRPRGFKGCTVFECFGAGQKVAQHTFRGVNWHDDPGSGSAMFATFPIMRRLHEMLWYLTEIIDMPVGDAITDCADAALSTLTHLADSEADRILEAPMNELWDDVADLIGLASSDVRGRITRTLDLSNRIELFRADAIGANLRGADLRAVNARGAALVAADLRDADARWADLAGADLRDAQLHRVDLSTSLFVTQQQMNSAVGDTHTRLPDGLHRPAHWTTDSVEDAR